MFRVGISWKFPSLFESETSERIERENARTSSPHPYHCQIMFTNKHKQEDTEYKRWPPETKSLGDDLINNVCCGDRSDKSQTHHQAPDTHHQAQGQTCLGIVKRG